MKLFGKRFFLPKYGGGYQVIGLVEVVWKVCAEVVKFWLKCSLILHDVLHRFNPEGYGGGNLGGKVGATVGGACT